MNATSFIDQMILLKRGHDQCCKGLLMEYNLRASDLSVLMFLAAHRDPCTAREICDTLLIAKSLVSASVDSLVSRNLVRRETDAQDRRRVNLTLQDAADEIIARANALSCEYAQKLCAGIDAQDLQTMERVFAQISHNMNNLSATE